MAPTHHPSFTVEALYRVFVAPALRTATPPRRLPSTLPFQPYHSRPLSTTTPKLLPRPSKPAEVRTQKWNDEIPHRLITLIDPTTNQAEPRPCTKYDVLRTIDEKTHRLVQLSPDPSTFDPAFIPLCKIVSKKEEFDRERARKTQLKDSKKARAIEGSVKTLELNWAAAPNDLAHRLDKVREFLDEGRKVDVVLAVKKRGRQASEEECEGVLSSIRKAVDEVEGAREVKPMEGKMGAFATLSFQGRPAKVGKKVVDGEGVQTHGKEGKAEVAAA